MINLVIEQRKTLNLSEFRATQRELDIEFRTLYDAMIAQGEMTYQAALTQVMLMFQTVHKRLQLLEAWSRGHSLYHEREARR